MSLGRFSHRLRGGNTPRRQGRCPRSNVASWPGGVTRDRSWRHGSPRAILGFRLARIPTPKEAGESMRRSATEDGRQFIRTNYIDDLSFFIENRIGGPEFERSKWTPSYSRSLSCPLWGYGVLCPVFSVSLTSESSTALCAVPRVTPSGPYYRGILGSFAPLPRARLVGARGIGGELCRPTVEGVWHRWALRVALFTDACPFSVLTAFSLFGDLLVAANGCNPDGLRAAPGLCGSCS